MMLVMMTMMIKVMMTMMIIVMTIVMMLRQHSTYVDHHVASQLVQQHQHHAAQMVLESLV
jgi:biopolymer transport protein ExbD